MLFLIIALCLVLLFVLYCIMKTAKKEDEFIEDYFNR